MPGVAVVSGRQNVRSVPSGWFAVAIAEYTVVAATTVVHLSRSVPVRKYVLVVTIHTFMLILPIRTVDPSIPQLRILQVSWVVQVYGL